MLSWDRKRITGEGWEFSPVADFSQLTLFDCGDADLNDFIQNDAAKHAEELIAASYAFRFLEGNERTSPVAFVSMANDAIHLSKIQRKVVHYNVRRYSSYPAVKIGRLGVHKDLQGKDIGTRIIELIKCLLTTHNRTGCRFLSVDAYNEPHVLKFYKKNDFQFLLEDGEDGEDATRIMYYDLKRYKRAS